MPEEGRARARPSGVWVPLAAATGPGQGKAGTCSSIPLAAGTVERFQAHRCAFLSPGLPQEGRGCGGRAAGGRESPDRWFLLSGGQRFPLLCGTSPCPRHFGGRSQGCSLGLSERGQPLVVCLGVGVDGASTL